MILLHTISDQIVGQGFRTLEDQSVAERVTLVKQVLNSALNMLDRVAADYALRDETYQLASTGDPEYATSYFVDTTFIANHLSYLAIFNSKGVVVHAQSFALGTSQPVPLSAELRDASGPVGQLVQSELSNPGVLGLLNLSGGPMLMAARPVLTGQGDGRPAGTLIVGLALDQHELGRLSELTGMPLKLLPLIGEPSEELRPLLAQRGANNQVISTPLNDYEISGLTYLHGIGDDPGVLLEVTMSRDAYQSGRALARTYTLIVLGAGLLLALVLMVLLERSLLRRLSALSNQVRGIGESADMASRAATRGSDEISQVGHAISHMLDGLASARQYIAMSEVRYRQLAELMPDAIIVHDGERIIYSNRAGAQLLGDGDPAAMVGRPVDPVIAAVNADPADPAQTCERSLTRPGGEQIEVELVALPFHSQQKTATQTILRNISARKQTETALREARDAANAANQAKSQFIANMSHELRTPLTSIIGYAELLERDIEMNASAMARRDVEAISTASTHLLALINNVLDFSKIEAGDMSVLSEEVLIQPLLKRVQAAVQPIATQNRNRLHIDESPPILSLYTDSSHLSQILIGLVGNACKFTEDGEVRLQVNVDGRSGDGLHILFEINDTGIGIAPEQVSRLFDDFTQVDGSITRKYGGTGLGLSLSLGLARALGGDISVVSAPGVGSTFTLNLPLHYQQPVASKPRPAAGADVLQTPQG